MLCLTEYCIFFDFKNNWPEKPKGRDVYQASGKEIEDWNFQFSQDPDFDSCQYDDKLPDLRDLTDLNQNISSTDHSYDL